MHREIILNIQAADYLFINANMENSVINSKLMILSKNTNISNS